MTTSTTDAAANSEAAVHTFVAFMTAFGGAQQVLKTRMQGHAEPGLGPLHLRALYLCQRNPGAPQQQLVQALGRAARSDAAGSADAEGAAAAPLR